MFKFFLKTWGSTMVGVIAAVVLWRLNYQALAVMAALLGLSGTFCIKLKSFRPSMTTAFLCGACIGGATLSCCYAAIAVLVELLLLFGVMKVYSNKVFWTVVFGFLTPLWIYLPYYLYQIIRQYAL